MRVRHIADSDWDGIVALESSAYSDISLSEGRAALESRAQASPATCFVLDHGGRITGYVLALPYPRFQYPELTRGEEVIFHSRNLHLHDIVVDEEFRGRGLARRLLHHLTVTAGAKTYEHISLISVGDNETFWAANGFHAHPHVPLPRSYGATAVYMSRAVQGGRAGSPAPFRDPLPGSPPHDEVG
ncbi:GNAT family N-acetyltransferase [Streptomyces sp. NPDC079020]|uniref:GNAT family N-acetyltransferase n=1 Tax=Streptomyces sp. NPDC079020 TaxID=3365722 RepID=UPI0037CEECE9